MKFHYLWVLTFFLFSSCGNKEKPSAEPTTAVVDKVIYYTLGDPEKIIEDNKLSPTTRFTPSEIQDLHQNYTLSSLTLFMNYEEKVDDSNVDLEEQNKAAEEDNSKTQHGLISAQLVGTQLNIDVSSYFSLVFDEDGNKPNKFNLFKVIDTETGDEYAAEMKHFSIKPDRSSFSILFYLPANDEYGKTLASVVFYRVSPIQKTAELTNDEYKYLFGPGVKVPHNLDQDITYTIMGKESIQHQGKIRSSVTPWNTALKDITEIKIAKDRTPPPFSDVNTHGVYFIKDYLFTGSENFSVNGITIIVPNLSNLDIADSDIIISYSEWEKYGAGYQQIFNKKIEEVLTHELGHFLGLDHQFDDLVPSIMSYETNRVFTNYDKKAIRALYSNEKFPSSLDH